MQIMNDCTVNSFLIVHYQRCAEIKSKGCKGWVSSRPVLGRFFDFINRCGEALLRFDIQPYGASSQKLAAILCSKSPADGRVLRPEREGDSPLDYLAQHWEESWPPLIWKGNPEAEAVASAMVGEGAVADVGWTRDLLSCLSASRLNDYRDWIKVGFVLKSMGRASGEQDAFFQLWNEWSASGAKYDGELACRKKWDSFSTPEGTRNETDIYFVDNKQACTPTISKQRSNMPILCLDGCGRLPNCLVWPSRRFRGG